MQDVSVWTELFVKRTHIGVLLNYILAHPQITKISLALMQLKRALLWQYWGWFRRHSLDNSHPKETFKRHTNFMFSPLVSSLFMLVICTSVPLVLQVVVWWLNLHESTENILACRFDVQDRKILQWFCWLVLHPRVEWPKGLFNSPMY